MKLRNLRWRLMALAVAWVAASLVGAAMVLQFLFVTNLERTVVGELESALTRLVALVDLTAEPIGLTAQMPDPRYESPLGGRYWQVEELASGTVLRSRSLWDTTIPVDVTLNSKLSHFTGLDGLHLVYMTESIEAADRRLRITTAQDYEPVRQAAAKFARDMTRLFALLGLLILLAAWLQLKLGLAPLARLRQSIEEVRNGQQRLLIGGFPGEVMPLVEEVNALLDEREVNAERARRRAADLAHGLKTPLAALQGIALKVREKGDDDNARLIEDLSFEMSRRVEYQMRLASLRPRNSAHLEVASLNSAVIRTITVLKKTGRGDTLHWMAELPVDYSVNMHRQDLMELIGVILENAAKWANTRVMVQSRPAGAGVELAIIDDGPGIPADRVVQLGQRGKRMDEGAAGTGLGLAIATEILAINGGHIRYEAADSGGLAVRITLPIASP